MRRKRRIASQVTDERRRAEGQERIASTAVGLFLNSGYHNTSVREIAHKAGLSVGSVFNYFTSKEQILFYIFSSLQSRTEAILQAHREEFTRLKAEGVEPKALFLMAYERYARLTDELRRYIVLAYQEYKSLTVVERQRLFEGEERIQRFIEEVIAYGIEQGVLPAGNVALKAHCLIVIAQSWAVSHRALKQFGKVDDYLLALKSVALGIVEDGVISRAWTPAVVARGEVGRATIDRSAPT